MIVNTGIHEYLSELFPTSAEVLEIGSGEGTVRLSERGFEVTTIEHDREYLNMAEDITYIHAPLVPYRDKYFRDATLWYDRNKLLNLPSYDAIIIDGPKGSQGRGGFFTNIDLFKSSLYIFDDTHRMWEFRLAGKVAGHFHVSFETFTDGNRWFSVVDTHGPKVKHYGRP